MKRFILLAAVCSAAFAENWTGTIVDVMCKGRDLSSHTRDCAVSCATGGYGVVLGDGKFLKFDEGGNARALQALKKSSKDKDLKVKVAGKLDGEVIQVETLELQ